MEVGLDEFTVDKAENIEFVRKKLETNVLDIVSRLDLKKSINLALDNPSDFKTLDDLATDLNLVNILRSQINSGAIEQLPEEVIRDNDKIVSKIHNGLNGSELLVGELSLTDKDFLEQIHASDQKELDYMRDDLRDNIRPLVMKFRSLAMIYRSYQDEKKC